MSAVPQTTGQAPVSFVDGELLALATHFDPKDAQGLNNLFLAAIRYAIPKILAIPALKPLLPEIQAAITLIQV